MTLHPQLYAGYVVSNSPQSVADLRDVNISLRSAGRLVPQHFGDDGQRVVQGCFGAPPMAYRVRGQIVRQPIASPYSPDSQRQVVFVPLPRPTTPGICDEYVSLDRRHTFQQVLAQSYGDLGQHDNSRLVRSPASLVLVRGKHQQPIVQVKVTAFCLCQLTGSASGQLQEQDSLAEPCTTVSRGTAKQSKQFVIRGGTTALTGTKANPDKRVDRNNPSFHRPTETRSNPAAVRFERGFGFPASVGVKPTFQVPRLHRADWRLSVQRAEGVQQTLGVSKTDRGELSSGVVTVHPNNVGNSEYTGWTWKTGRADGAGRHGGHLLAHVPEGLSLCRVMCAATHMTKPVEHYRTGQRAVDANK